MPKVTIQCDAVLTPAILAKAFWAMSDTDQAEFFNCLAKEVDSETASGAFQWAYMADHMSGRAVDVLESMYEHGMPCQPNPDDHSVAASSRHER